MEAYRGYQTVGRYYIFNGYNIRFQFLNNAYFLDIRHVISITFY